MNHQAFACPHRRPVRTSVRIVALVGAAMFAVACGGGAAATGTATETASKEPAAPLPPQVSKEAFGDLEIRVLELEVEVRNLRAALGAMGVDVGGDTVVQGEEPAAGDPAKWTYADSETWSELSAEFSACGAGMEQSPIDLGEVVGEDISNAIFRYAPVSGATIVDDGHSVQMTLPAAGSIVLDDKQYQFVQLHFHSPSEHTVEGERYPLEVHFMHQAQDGSLAVVAVLVTEGAPWPAYDSILVSMPLEENVPADVVGEIDLNALLPDLTAAYRYAGSLTTPPCTEGVAWSVLQGTISMSAPQINQITSVLGEANARPVQPSNDRDVVIDLSAE